MPVSPVGGDYDDASFSPDGKTLYFKYSPQDAEIYHLAKLQRIAWPAGSIPSSVAVRWLALSVVGQSRYDGADRQWQAADHQEQALGTIIDRYVRHHPSAFFS